jgi:hypothetical protein
MLFRWSTKVLTGQWLPSAERALADALRAGHAEEDGSSIVLRPRVWLERKGHERAGGRHLRLAEALE